MAAFVDALDLRTAVIEITRAPQLVEVFDRLVSQVEADIARRLRRVGDHVATTITIASGTANLPAGFAEMIGLYDGNGHEYIQVPVPEIRPNGYYYAIGNGVILTSLLAGTLDMDYYAAPDSIAGDLTATNAVLAAYPNTYFFGVMIEAGRYLRDEAMIGQYMPLYEREYQLIRANEDAKRYSRARVRLHMVTP